MIDKIKRKIIIANERYYYISWQFLTIITIIFYSLWVGYRIIEYAYHIITLSHFHIIDEEFNDRTAYCNFLKFYSIVTSFHAWPASKSKLTFFLSSNVSLLSLSLSLSLDWILQWKKLQSIWSYTTEIDGNFNTTEKDMTNKCTTFPHYAQINCDFDCYNIFSTQK